MVRRRVVGIAMPLGCHSVRARGITADLVKDGTLETTAVLTNHTSTRITQLYDRRGGRVSLDEVERIRQILGMLAGLVRGRHSGPFRRFGRHGSLQTALSRHCLVSRYKLDHNPTYSEFLE